MTDLITETSRHTGLQVASLAEIGRESSAIILIFDQHNKAKATAVALLPDGRRFVNRALRLDSLEEGHKWDTPARKVHYVFDEDIRPDADYEPGSPEYSLVEGRDIGTWYFIGVGEDDKAWQELKDNGYPSKREEEQVSHFIDDIKVGQEIRVFHNQAYRYGQVVARIGGDRTETSRHTGMNSCVKYDYSPEILGVFTLGNGKNVLAVWGFNKVAAYPINLIIPAALRNPIESHPKYEFLRTVSFNSIPKKWKNELAKTKNTRWRQGTDAELIINFLEEEFSGEDNTI